MKRYYLDTNATAPLDPAARAAMLEVLGSGAGNPSSFHAEGRRARGTIDSARDELSALLKAKPLEIIFTGGGTESCNLAVLGLARAHAERGRHLITSDAEHPCVLNAFRRLEREGFDVTYVGVDADGRTDPDEIADAIVPATRLVSVMSANNETGVCSPLAEIGAICGRRGVFFHIDAAQSAGKETLEVDRWQATAISLAAHKFGGPLGAGILWLKSGIPIMRLIEGGAHETERRPGTENTAAIAGMAAAAARYFEIDATEAARQRHWIERLWSELETLGGVHRNGHAIQRVPNTLNVSFAGVQGEELLIGLDLAGLAVSSGSACLVGSIEPSHVLAAMGVQEDGLRAAVRFSIGRDIPDHDLPEIARRVKEVVTHQRAAHGGAVVRVEHRVPAEAAA